MNKIGNNLINLRNKIGKTQKEVADMLQVSDKTLGHWENNKREPSFEMLQKLADIYNVTIGELFGETKAKNSNDILIDKIIDDLIEEGIISETKSFEALDPASKQILIGALNKHIMNTLEKKSSS